MTTDTTALQERIARVLHEIDPISGHGHDWRKLSDAERKFYIRKAAAVLPTIETEVRKGQAEAWDEATRIALNFAYLNQEDRITLYLRPPHDRNPYRTTEAGDSDERR